MTLVQFLLFVIVAVGLLQSPNVGLAQEPATPRPSIVENRQQVGLSSDGLSPPSIEKLIAQRCLSCHSGPEPEGGINLTRPSSVAKNPEGVADLETSQLWQVIHDDEMPPDNPLSESERAIVSDWIVAGANGDFEPIDVFQFTTDQRSGYDWWSLQPIQRPEVPSVTDARQLKTPIDAFVVDELARQSLSLSPVAEPRDQIRRIYFDLVGLSPPAQVVEAFERNPTDDAYAAVVDDLLNSPEYGERWGRHWLDIVRYGESDGFERNGPRRDSWRYRDWVIDALNTEMPFDEFTRRQIAGDVLCEDPVEGMAASGFLVAGLHNTVVGSSKQMQLSARQDELEDLVGTIGQTFVGLTFNCARCHDHKFDPITQREYYQLTATMAGVSHGSRQARHASDEQRLDELTNQIKEFTATLLNLEKSTRHRILDERLAGTTSKPPSPQPLMEWQFAGTHDDVEHRPAVQLAGGARFSPAGLVLDGDGDFARAEPIGKYLNEKTLEAWVLLDGLDQQGGAAISIETPDGAIFDAIVFGEQEPQHWMAGSNGFSRTASFAGETEVAGNQPIQMTIVYSVDGTIAAYRNGVLYGKPYKSNGLQSFAADNTRVLFGLRHSPPGSNRFLKGTIVRARLYNRALTPDEVAASAGIETNYVSEAELIARLPTRETEQREKLIKDLKSLSDEKSILESSSLVSVYTAVSTTPDETRFLPRGDVMMPGDVVQPGTTAAVAQLVSAFENSEAVSESKRRVQLAAWLTDDANPLFARVAVNRLWHYHFGRGLIATPNDFGFNAGQPSHPALLDWLATELRDNGYRLKPLHKLIVTSAVYRQSSLLRDYANGIDSDNRWLWRKSLVRLDAEVVRDSILSIGGKLNRERGGPGYEDVTIIDQNNGTTYYESFDRDDPALNRRTIYRFTPRGGRSALLDSLDCPDPSAATPRRSVTTTPLQALSLLNNDFIVRSSSDFANRASAQSPGQLEQQISWMFWEVLSRAATAAEITAAGELADKHGLSAVARALLNSNEFLIVQ